MYDWRRIKNKTAIVRNDVLTAPYHHSQIQNKKNVGFITTKLLNNFFRTTFILSYNYYLLLGLKCCKCNHLIFLRVFNFSQPTLLEVSFWWIKHFFLILTDVCYRGSVPGSSAVPDTDPAVTDEDEPQALTFHGIILRSQLVTLLKKGVFYSENAQVNSITDYIPHILWLQPRTN